MKLIYSLILVSFLLSSCILCKEEGETEEELGIGNLGLPTSQQPEALFGFGQNVVGNQDLLVEEIFSFIKGPCSRNRGLESDFFYGLRENLTFTLFVPAELQLCQNGVCSRGINNILIGGEWAFYSKDSKKFAKQATFVFDIELPTGNSVKNPPTGDNSVSLFAGFTGSYIGERPYLYGSFGATITPPQNGNSLGSTLLYEFGGGYDFFLVKDWIFMGTVEWSGIFTHGISAGSPVPGAGDSDTTEPAASVSNTNIVFLGPTIFISTKKFILEAGIQWPIVQNGFSYEDKTSYRAAVSLVYKF
jgi:hypothetical protein